MRSMTGFGCGRHALDGGAIFVELRSVNHRFLDVRVRMPPKMGDLGALVEALVRERFSRGRFDVLVRHEGDARGLDRERARNLYRELCALRDEIAPGAEVPFAALTSMPEIFAEAAVSHERAVDAIRLAFADASSELDKARAREGQALAHDFENRLTHLGDMLSALRALPERVVAAQREKLEARIGKLLESSSVPLDPNRLEHEIVLFADRSDVTEELTRLGAHLEEFRRILSSPEAIGRRLDFLLQELGRETNTLGAKCQDSAMAHTVVGMKAELERLREQVQNIE